MAVRLSPEGTARPETDVVFREPDSWIRCFVISSVMS